MSIEDFYLFTRCVLWFEIIALLMKHFVCLAVHADGQYQSNTFQDAPFTKMGKVKELDEFFLTS